VPPPFPQTHPSAQALPILVAEDNRQGMELLAQQAGLELRRLMREQGHCVVARELFRGSASFGACISVLEEVTGEVRGAGGGRCHRCTAGSAAGPAGPAVWSAEACRMGASF
jgi:hypothetical protein